MKVFLIRIGETKAHTLKVLSNRPELSHLTETGKAQVSRVAHREDWRRAEIERIFASHAPSGGETAAILARGTSQGAAQIVRIPDFRALHWGEWEGKSKTDLEWDYPKEWNDFRNGKGRVVPGEKETLQDVARRMINGLNKLYEEFPDKCVAIVGHGVSSRIMIAVLQGKPAHEFSCIGTTNTGVTIFEFQRGAPAKFSCINNASHLEGMPTPITPVTLS